MIALITGGSGSGKSAYAEDLATRIAKERNSRLIYLATMHNSGKDPETLKRIERHRAMRAGKGFVTVEQESHLEERLSELKGDTILLEDLSNLLTNEVYFGERIRSKHDTGFITDPLFQLAEQGCDLIIVTNEIGFDLPSIYEESVRFAGIFGKLNCEIAARADLVAEVSAGIPTLFKQPQGKDIGC